MSSIFDYYLNQPADAYLAAHGGQVPDFEQVLADLTAAKPHRAALLAFLADALRQDLLALSDQPAPSAPDRATPGKVTNAELVDLTARLWHSPHQIRICRVLRAALDSTDRLATHPATDPPASSTCICGHEEEEHGPSGACEVEGCFCACYETYGD